MLSSGLEEDLQLTVQNVRRVGGRMGWKTQRPFFQFNWEMLFVTYHSSGLQVQCWRGWPARSPWGAPFSLALQHAVQVCTPLCHPCNCTCMYTCSHSHRHMHTYTCAYPCVTWLSRKDVCGGVFPSFYRSLGLLLSICDDILEVGNLECLVVGQKGEESSYTQSVPQERVCVCTPMDIPMEGPVSPYTFVHNHLPDWWLVSVVLESVCLTFS